MLRRYVNPVVQTCFGNRIETLQRRNGLSLLNPDRPSELTCKDRQQALPCSDDFGDASQTQFDLCHQIAAP